MITILDSTLRNQLQMAEFGSVRGGTRKRNRGMSSMDSVESYRRVLENEEYYEVDLKDNDGGDGEDIMLHIDMDSDDEDSLHQKFIHTGPKIDSFGVETFDVPGAHTIDFELQPPVCLKCLLRDPIHLTTLQIAME
ncbi:hypothetical protein HanIR_Chr13g0662141 [Helianthus annuus]|nr:hypothetical protein HanIR_Chr13g0662141 [Helianthus annuus]KAJ0499317.1 hypothetical protein HanHA89_Chr13g0532791 [Helianthus annuus]KAJ0665337.1 hypothetical protein HanLR1_Chr13g0502881 [Helianthus annuus]